MQKHKNKNGGQVNIEINHAPIHISNNTNDPSMFKETINACNAVSSSLNKVCQLLRHTLNEIQTEAKNLNTRKRK